MESQYLGYKSIEVSQIFCQLVICRVLSFCQAFPEFRTEGLLDFWPSGKFNERPLGEMSVIELLGTLVGTVKVTVNSTGNSL